MTTSEIQQKIQDIHVALSANPDPNTRQKLELGLEIFQSLLLAEHQKKSESQPSKNAGQPQRTPIRDAAAKVPQEIKDEVEEWAEKVEREETQDQEVDELIKWVENSPIEPMTDEEWEAYQEWKKIPKEEKAKQHKAFVAEMDSKHIKTVKAPEFVAPEELINVTLEDAKGNEYTRIGTKAQVRALTRKYFSNVHESWMGKERKMKTGFKNLLAYVVAWKEFDGALPVLRDVLPDYDRYNKGGESKEASDAFKVAQELYKKIVEILQA